MVTKLAPSPEEQLIAIGAGTAQRRSDMQSRIASLRADADPTVIAELLRERHLLTLLGPRMVEMLRDDACAQLRSDVDAAVAARRRQNATLQMVSERTVSVLADAGIRCMWLKGPGLSQMLYEDLGRRPSSDIDLLVDRERLFDAVEVVHSLGYESPKSAAAGQLPPLHFELLHGHRHLPPLELHWRIHWYEAHFAQDRLLPPSVDEPRAWQPELLDTLAALLLFYARDGFLNVRHAIDVGAFWDRFGSQLRHRPLDDLISRYPALERVLTVAAVMAERTVGVPREQLRSHRSALDRRSRLAIRLSELQHSADEAQLYADMGLIDGLLAPPAGLRAFVRRQVLPSRVVLREHADRAHKARRSSGVGHGVRVIARYGLSLSRLISSRRRTHTDRAIA